jgi:hypothetical protein
VRETETVTETHTVTENQFPNLDMKVIVGDDRHRSMISSIMNERLKNNEKDKGKEKEEEETGKDDNSLFDFGGFFG